MVESTGKENATINYTGFWVGVGASLAPGTKFCEYCGAKIREWSFCTHCGHKIGPEDKFCPGCGVKLS